jgi:DNA-binding response OmpR family regulator
LIGKFCAGSADPASAGLFAEGGPSRAVVGAMGEALPYGPLKVLVAEDDQASREALQKAVRMLGHECRAARDGLDAWSMHLDERADVILSDWRMPRMDGLELCRRTRAAETDGRRTYFVFLTHFADYDHVLEGMAAGADDYHGKPIDLDELQARLDSARRVLSLLREGRAANTRPA